jgi:hypothetical protein
MKKVRETETSAAETSHEIEQRNYLSELRTRNGLDGLLPASQPELPCELDLDSLNIGVGSKYRSTSSAGELREICAKFLQVNAVEVMKNL